MHLFRVEATIVVSIENVEVLMADLDRELVKKVSELCRIGCTEEEITAILRDMGDILSYVDQLKEVETENTPPCNHVIQDVNNVMRGDIVKEVMPRETFLSNAPEHVSGMIKVPTVIKKRD